MTAIRGRPARRHHVFMDLRQFKYFVAIVDHASLSKAASHLFVAQPALSLHVRHMEEELQVTLLSRTSRGVSPTDEGKRLYLHAKKLLALASETRDAVRDAMVTPVGDVRIGLAATVGELIGAPLMQAVAERYSSLRLTPVEAPGANLLGWLRQGDVDLVVTHVFGDQPDLDVLALLSERLVLCAGVAELARAPTAPTVAMADVLALPLILPSAASALRQAVDSAAARSGAAPARPRYEVDAYAQIKRMAMAGAGFAVLPETNVRREVQEGTLRQWPIGEPTLARRVAVIHSRERHLPSAARAVRLLVIALARELIGDGTWTATAEPEQHDLQL